MKKYCCLFFFVLSSIALLAQQPSARKSTQTTQPEPSSDRHNVNSPGVDPPSHAQVMKLLDLLKVRDTIKITIDATRQQVLGNAEETFREKISNPTPEQLKSLRAIVEDVFSEISLEEIIKDVVPVYQRHLTKSDVAALITFYSSPVGQKVLREQSAMVRESMEATAAGQQRKMESLMAKLDLRVQQLALEEQNKNAPPKK
jgi:hypothetical protein